MIPLLFSKVSIFDVLQHQQAMLKQDVENLQREKFQTLSEQELVHEITLKYKLELPVLEEEKAYLSHREVDVDVSRDPMRLIFDRSRPFYIKGTEITVSIPFKGDPNIFQVRPSTFTMNPPRGEIRAHEIHLVYRRTDNNAAAVKSEYERAIQEIKQHLGWLEGSIADFNRNIGQQVNGLVQQRKEKLSAAANMISEIGLPVRQTEQRTPVPELNRDAALRKSTKSSKKWDVFISHSSEDKDELVRPLAKALQAKGVSVWYDEFSLKMGDSLRASIDYGLVNSRFGVVILSKSFFAKHWPTQELNGLSAKEVKGKKVILPIWHKVTSEDVREFSPTLADRLAVSSNVGIDQLVSDISGVLEQE